MFCCNEFPLINSHYTLAEQFFLNFIHGFSLSLAGETIFEGDTSRGREDPDFPSLIAHGNVYWSTNVLNPAHEFQAKIK